MRLLLLFMTVASLTLAGCVGGEDFPVETASTEDGAQPTPEIPAQVESPAPSNASAPAPATPPPSELREPPQPVVTPFTYSGSLEASAVFCDGVVGACARAPVDAVGYDWVELTFDGVSISGEFTLTWDAESPLTERLVMVADLCGAESCESISVRGTSPLTLAYDDVEVEPFVLIVAAERTGIAWVSTDQTFEVDGQITTLPPDLEEAPAPVVTTSIPFAFDGRFSSNARACTPVRCQTTPTSDVRTVFNLESTGPLSAAIATVSWTAESALTTELGMFARVCLPEFVDCETLAAITGASPITFDAIDLNLPAGSILQVIMHQPTTSALVVSATLEQSFLIEGTLTELAS